MYIILRTAKTPKLSVEGFSFKADEEESASSELSLSTKTQREWEQEFNENTELAMFNNLLRLWGDKHRRLKFSLKSKGEA